MSDFVYIELNNLFYVIPCNKKAIQKFKGLFLGKYDEAIFFFEKKQMIDFFRKENLTIIKCKDFQIFKKV